MTVARTEAGPGSADNVSMAEKVAFLSAMPGAVQVIETHMAYVFLAPTHAFKLKQPVSFGYFDHRACAAELQLNRELAGNVYIRLKSWRRMPSARPS